MVDLPSYTKDELLNFVPQHHHFVGIDSDGCVVDTMEIKQKQCFHPLILTHWGLQAIESYVRETAEFVNLYSRWRGQNRFIAMVKTFEMLRRRPEVQASGVEVPALTAMQQFMDSGAPLGNPALQAEVEKTGNPELTLLLRWSEDVNRVIAETVQNVPPFPHCRESLSRIQAAADAICVSQTPEEALVREWSEHDILRYVSIIAGQELGTKTEHLKMAAAGRYRPENILMIGDAPGDLAAAKANNALFYPILPAHEADAWKRFHDEAFDLFLDGRYAGDYEAERIAEFQALLPDVPPWEA